MVPLSERKEQRIDAERGEKEEEEGVGGGGGRVSLGTREDVPGNGNFGLSLSGCIIMAKLAV